MLVILKEPYKGNDFDTFAINVEFFSETTKYEGLRETRNGIN